MHGVSGHCCAGVNRSFCYHHPRFDNVAYRFVSGRCMGAHTGVGRALSDSSLLVAYGTLPHGMPILKSLPPQRLAMPECDNSGISIPTSDALFSSDRLLSAASSIFDPSTSSSSFHACSRSIKPLRRRSLCAADQDVVHGNVDC